MAGPVVGAEDSIVRASTRAIVASAAVAALATLASAPGGAQPAAPPESCSSGQNPDDNFGPICAVLAPPITTYHLLDVRDDGVDGDISFSTNVSWRETTVTCGSFSPRTGAPSGTQPQHADEWAQWSHANGAPDNCTHEAPEHPGTINVNAWPIVRNFKTLSFPLDAGVIHCSFSGSNSGVSPPCESVLEVATCEAQDEDGLVITPGGLKVNIAIDGSKVVIDWMEPGIDTCRLPLAGLSHVLMVPGGESPAPIKIRLDKTWTSSPLGLGLNALEAGGTLDISGGSGADEMRIESIEPFDEVSNGGVTVDADGDGEADVIGINLDKFAINGGGGNDKFELTSPLYDYFGGGSPNPTPLKLAGGSGNDTVTFGAGDPPESGIDIAVGLGAKLGQVNLLDGQQDRSLDVFLGGFEKLRINGGTGNDVIGGAGGSGTGDPSPLPLLFFGLDGNDTLLGGSKPDTLDGGPGQDTCDGGAGKDKGVACETMRRM